MIIFDQDFRFKNHYQSAVMIKNVLPIIITFFSGVYTIAQVTDIPPNGKQNYRAVTGGSVKVNIDTVSSLMSLINKLDSNWEFVETGKMYWIGYTHDMYSIAAHKDSVIESLIEHFYSTKSKNGKYGVIYTLHLIGIESSIAGRFIEKFKNRKARGALLRLASDQQYRGTIISLLGRDPWKSDLPILVEFLKQDNHCVELVNALFRYVYDSYKTDNVPFRQDVSEDLDTLNIVLQDSLGTFDIGQLINLSGKEAASAEQQGTIRPGVVVQWGKNKRIFKKFIASKNEIKRIASYFKCKPEELAINSCREIDNLLYDLILASTEKISPFSYCDYWDPFHHYVEQNNLVICTTEQSAKRWLEYFANTPVTEKE